MPGAVKKTIIFLFFLIGVLSISWGQSAQSLRVEMQSLYPDTRVNRQFFRDLFEESAYYYPLIYGGNTVIEYGPGPAADYRLSISAVDSGENSVFMLTLTRSADGKTSQPFSVLDAWSGLDGRYAASLVQYLLLSLDDFAAPADRVPPLLLERFTLDYLSFRDLPYQPILSPISAAYGEDGSLYIGANSLAVRLDSSMRLADVYGREAILNGQQGEFFDIAVTPSGTLYSRSIQQLRVSRYIPGNPAPDSLPIPFQYPSDFIVLPDGSLVLSDMTSPRIFRVQDRRPQELRLLENALISPSAMAAGPSGELWIYNPSSGFVEIFTPSGEPVRTLLPLFPVGERYSVKHLQPASDGSFLMMTMTSLYRFSPGGDIIWRLEGIPGEEDRDYTFAMGLAFNEASGEIAIPMSTQNYILRLLDGDYLERNALETPESVELAKWTAAILENPADQDAIAELAGFHHQNGAVEMARYYWNTALLINPDNQTAREELEDLELASLIEQTEILRARVLDTLRRFGPESARSMYQKTVALYEEILFSRPDDREIRRAKERLQQQFDIEAARPGQQRNMLDIRDARLPDVFPALVPYYRLSGWGSLTIANPHELPVSEITLELYIPGFMEAPVAVDVDGELAPGEELEISLNPVFNERLLLQEESLPAQVILDVKGRYDGVENVREASYSVQIQRNTALSWDDSAKLASFIVPNEINIRNFALTASGSADYRDLTPDTIRLDERLFRAIRIIDTLGTRGIEYIEDPASPITLVLGRPGAVDTVRFPGATLFYQSGDCDDTTALLNSMLEAAGISTAIITSPGHVFAAFDSDIPEENRWLLEQGGLELISHGGTLWIPIETTVLDQGFFETWQQASLLVSRHRGSDEMEFIPVSEARELYPPMPIPPTDYRIIPPSPAAAGRSIAQTMEEFTEQLFVQKAGELTRQSQALTGRRRSRLLNRLGALYSVFGEFGLAEATLRDANQIGGGNMTAYQYLTNLYLEQGDYQRAARTAEEGLEIRPDSPYLLLSLALAHAALNDDGALSRDFERLSRLDPELAERYAYLAAGSADGSPDTRAGAGLPPVIWPEEDGGER